MEPDRVAHLRLESITKRFGGVQALTGVDLAVDRGTVHALVGENGAGKSTLGKIIAGVHQPDEGRIRLDAGDPIQLASPAQALQRGITIIGQEPALELRRSIAENVLLGMEPGRRWWVDRPAQRRACADIAREAGFDAIAEEPGRLVATLGAADRQKVEILRALARRASLIVMDEPTASLQTTDADHLLEEVVRLRERGITVLYISHRLTEVIAVADHVTVLRDGRLVSTKPVAEVTREGIVADMLGRAGDTVFPPKPAVAAGAPVVLEVEGLRRDPAVAGVDLTVREGEIVGLAGLVGSGRTEIARLIYGADDRDGGRITLDGRDVRFRSPREAIGAGVVMLPESRKSQGLILARSVKENITLSHLASLSRAGVLERRRERGRAVRAAEQLDVRMSSVDDGVTALSGGNQQKVLFARSLLRSPRLLIVDEPTRGIDVGAKRSIYELIGELASEGMAVLLISSELDEVVGLSHRVVVIREGRVVDSFGGEAIDEGDVLRAAIAA